MALLNVVYEFEFTGNTEIIELEPGIYKFEVWGARGGINKRVGGRGGYSHGIIALTKRVKAFINVGSSNGFNGGGKSYNATIFGGGATDIRFISNSLYHRAIVAGGGGAGGGYEYGDNWGGNAGGLIGIEPDFGGEGGRPDRGGKCIIYDENNINTSPTRDGDFGRGGDVLGINAGPGGGGWYGGGAGSGVITKSTHDIDPRPGGGGSSFIYTNKTKNYLPTGYALTSEYMFSNGYLVDGSSNIVLPDSQVNHWEGPNGFARITTYSLFNFNLNQIKPVSAHRLNFRHFSLFASILF